MCDCNLYLNYLGSTQERYCMSCPSLWSQKISTPTTRRIYTRSSKGQAVSNDKICKAKCVTKTGISSGMGFGRGEGVGGGSVGRVNKKKMWREYGYVLEQQNF